jgi:hypothetical protein
MLFNFIDLSYAVILRDSSVELIDIVTTMEPQS